MKDIHAIIDKVADQFREVIENTVGRNDEYDMEQDQPQHFSWLHIWASVKGLATDTTIAITYKDAEEFQEEVVKATREFFNTDTLQPIINGELTMIGMQIGPEQPSGGNINDELGLEISDE